MGASRVLPSGLGLRKVEISGDRGALSGDVSRLRCSGRQRAIYAFVSTSRRVGKPTPAVGPHDLPVRRQVESSPPVNANRGLRMDIVVEREGLRHGTASHFRHKLILVAFTIADPHAAAYLRAGSADPDGSAASNSDTRKRNHYAGPGGAFFDDLSHKLVTFGMGTFGRIGREGGGLIDQNATNECNQKKQWGVHGQGGPLPETPSTYHLSNLLGRELTSTS